MNLILSLVVLCFTVTNLCVCEESRKRFQKTYVSGTNLTYDTNYFIKWSAYDSFLRYDGNNNGDISGLTYVTQSTLTNSTDQSLIRSYIFVIERDVNSLIKIKNIRSNRYISFHNSSFGFVLSNSSAYNNSLRLVKEASSNSMNIISADSGTENNPYLDVWSEWRANSWINTVSTSSSSNDKFEFIAAPNITQLQAPVIGDTDLAYGHNYFIKYAYNNYFHHWDGNTNGSVSGLRYTIQNDIANIPESVKESYLFVIEPDINSTIKLRNVRTNRYLYYYQIPFSGFALSNNNDYNTSFRLVLNPATNLHCLVDPTTGVCVWFTNAYSTSLNLYYISRPNTNAYYYLQFINSTQSTPTTTTTTTTTTTSAPISTNSTPVTTTTTTMPTPAPCLPLLYTLRAVVGSYQYEIPDPEFVDESTETLTIIPRTVINNTSPGSITEKIVYNENIEEIYKWFYTSLNKLNIKIEQKRVKLPPIVRRNIAFKNSNENKISSSLNLNKNIEVVYNREINIDRTIEVKPQTSSDYIVYAEYINSLEFNFKALAKINGNDTSGNELTGSQLNEIIQTCANFTVVEINDKSIVIEVNGVLVADLIAGYFFEVNSKSDHNFCDPDCQPIP